MERKMMSMRDVLSKLERRLEGIEKKVDAGQAELLALSKELMRSSPAPAGPIPPDLGPRAVTKAVAAKMMSRSVRTLEKMIKDQELRPCIIGDRLLIPMSEVERLTKPQALTASSSKRGSPPSTPPRGRKKSAQAKTAAQRFRELARRRD